MSRLRTLLTVALPSMIAGGLVFNTALGRAASTDAPSWSGSSTLVAQADPPRVPRRVPRVPPVPPVSPVPPVALTGIGEMIAKQLKEARDNIAKSNMPKEARDKMLARFDKAQAKVNARLAKMKTGTPDQLEEQMEAMGEEIEAAMEGLDVEMEEMGEKMAHDAMNNINIDVHDDDDDDMPSAPALDSDDDDLRDAIGELKDLAVKPAQRDAIVKLRSDSDKAVATSKKQLDVLSEKLHVALGDSKITDADINRMVDQISAEEAKIRKARILAWAQARRVLDAQQQKKVEDAAKKKTSK